MVWLVVLDVALAALWLALCAAVAWTQLDPASSPWPGPPFWPVAWWGESDPGPWCEADRAASLLREPANAATDLPFFAYALYMVRCGIHDGARGALLDRRYRFSLRAHPLLEVLCGVVNFVHAFGTFTNHACRCHTGHVLDVFGMFSILSFYSIYQVGTLIAVARERRVGATGAPGGGASAATSMSTATAVAAQALVCACAWPASQLAYADAWCETAELVGFVLCLLPTLVVHVIMRARHAHVAYDGRRIVLSLVLLLAGVAAQSIDQPRHGFGWVCDPTSPLQLHAAWHLLTGASLIIMFGMYRDVECGAVAFVGDGEGGAERSEKKKQK